VLEGASGSIYPGFAPHRLDLASAGAPRPLDQKALAAAIARALPDVGAAIAAFQAHKRDLFAPDRLPLAIRVETVLATGRRAQIIDNEDRALFLPEDRALFDRLGGALHRAKLRALIGEAGLQGALPTFFPYAAIVERANRLELASLLRSASFAGTRKVLITASKRRGPALWIEAAREAGASQAAIALGEMREELAGFFVTGLTTLNERTAAPMIGKLRELGLVKPAELLDGLSRRPDPAARLDEFIKLFSVLEVAVIRLIAAAHVDRATLVKVPLHESVLVALGDREDNRWEAAVKLTRRLESAPDSELASSIYPAWADGSLSIFVAEALKDRGEPARLLAERVLAEPHGKMVHRTARRVLEALAPPPPKKVTPEDATKLERFTAILLHAPRGEQRIEAARAAIPVLRLSHAGDMSASVRAESARALARMNDVELTQTLIDTLAERHENPTDAGAAVSALAELGDVRAKPELEAALAEGFKPLSIKKALAAITPEPPAEKHERPKKKRVR
jgi:hypothetical protein